MITGQVADFYPVAFTDEMSPEGVIAQYQSLVVAGDEVVIIVDFIGGTPCNAAFMLQADYPEIVIVSGLSLSLIIQLSIGLALDFAVNEARDNVQILKKIAVVEGEEEDE